MKQLFKPTTDSAEYIPIRVDGVNYRGEHLVAFTSSLPGSDVFNYLLLLRK